MIPLHSHIQIDRSSDVLLFVQLSNQITQLISSGLLKPGLKLPGTRVLSEQLNLHRKTVVAAYEELALQGWIDQKPSVGAFVSDRLPHINAKPVVNSKEVQPAKTNIEFIRRPHLQRFDQPKAKLVVDEGIPDLRLAPVQEFRRMYSQLMARTYNHRLIGYNSPVGNPELRKALTRYLADTRGLAFSEEEVLITRGSQMGIYLAAQLLVGPGDLVVTGQYNYIATDLTFKERGARLLTITTDDEGIDVGQLEEVCQKQNVRLVYLTPHHHHPTTVTLSAERRLRLLQLAEKHDFLILEDDYDYDFHYLRSPIMPLASADQSGRVIYIGGISKLVAPGLRVGYLIANSEVIKEAANLRRIIDRQGDYATEQVIAQMINQGDIQRHSKKALKVYHQRRDHFAEGLASSGLFDFKIPDGGMAFWVHLNDQYKWSEIAEKLLKKHISIPDFRNYDRNGEGHNNLRLGFASMNIEEMSMFFRLLNAMTS